MAVMLLPSLSATATSGFTPSSIVAVTASGRTAPLAGSSASTQSPTRSVSMPRCPLVVATSVPAGKQAAAQLTGSRTGSGSPSGGRVYAPVGNGALKRELWSRGHRLPGRDRVLIGQQVPPQGQT